MLSVVMHCDAIRKHFLLCTTFDSAAALHAVQSAVIPTAIPSVRLSVCLSVRLSHAGTLSRRMNIGLRGLHCEVAKTL